MFMQTIILVSSFGLFIWEQFFHVTFLLWKFCINITVMFNVCLTNLNQEDIVYKKQHQKTDLF